MQEDLRQKMLVEFGKTVLNIDAGAISVSGQFDPKEAVGTVYKVIECFEKQEKRRERQLNIEICDGILKQINEVEAARDPKALHPIIHGLSQVLVRSGQHELVGLAVGFAQLMKDQAPATMSMELVNKAREMTADVRGILRKALAAEEPTT